MQGKFTSDYMHYQGYQAVEKYVLLDDKKEKDREMPDMYNQILFADVSKL